MVLAVRGGDTVETTAKDGSVHTVCFSRPFRRVSVVEALQQAIGGRLPALEETGGDPRMIAPLIMRHRGDTTGSAGNLQGPGHWCVLSRTHKRTATMAAATTPCTCAHLLDLLVGKLIEPLCIQPTFLCDHPTIMSPLAKQHPHKACRAALPPQLSVAAGPDGAIRAAHCGKGVLQRIHRLGHRQPHRSSRRPELNDPAEQRSRMQLQGQVGVPPQRGPR